jgi:hypothetical protein
LEERYAENAGQARSFGVKGGNAMTTKTDEEIAELYEKEIAKETTPENAYYCKQCKRWAPNNGRYHKHDKPENAKRKVKRCL